MDPRAFLIGQRVYLRALEDSDVNETYVSWLNDRTITHDIVAANFPQTASTIRTFVHSMAPPASVSFAICLIETDRHIGNIALRRIDWVHRRAELGILIGDRQVQGQGLGSEALRLLTRYSFDTLGLRRLFTGTSNDDAVRLFERRGWVREALLKEHVRVGGRVRDSHLFGLLSSEYNGEE